MKRRSGSRGARYRSVPGREVAGIADGNLGSRVAPGYGAGVRESMTRRGWLLFAAMSLIWGVPYLLIKVAVEASRTGGDRVRAHVDRGRAGARCWPRRSGALAAAARHWKLVLAFAAIEMAGPVVPAHQRREASAFGVDRSHRGVRADGRRRRGLPPRRSPRARADAPGRHRGRPRRGRVVGRARSRRFRRHPVVERRADVAGLRRLRHGAVHRRSPPPRRAGDGRRRGFAHGVALVYAPLAWPRAPTTVRRRRSGGRSPRLAVVCTAIAFIVFFTLISRSRSRARRR